VPIEVSDGMVLWKRVGVVGVDEPPH
jgi:hypothetical protein